MVVPIRLANRTWAGLLIAFAGAAVALLIVTDNTRKRPVVDASHPIHETVNAVYLSDSRRVLATLIRLLGDFNVAEEAMHDAFRAALEQWPRDGVPANPRAWLVSAGRFKAIDGIRRHARFDALEDVPEQVDAAAADPAEWDKESVADDRLRLIFTCCHPALAPDAQVA